MKNIFFKKIHNHFKQTIKVGVILCCIVFSQTSFGQIQETTWQVIVQQNGVKISYAVGNCTTSNQLMIKATNSNNAYTVTHFILATNQANDLKSPILIALEANEEHIINCENYQLYPELMMLTINNPSTFICTSKEVKISLYP